MAVPDARTGVVRVDRLVDAGRGGRKAVVSLCTCVGGEFTAGMSSRAGGTWTSGTVPLVLATLSVLSGDRGAAPSGVGKNRPGTIGPPQIDRCIRCSSGSVAGRVVTG